MAHVEVSARINVNPDTLWQEVGLFQGVGRWHPMLVTVEGHGETPGAVRTAHGADGSKQVEQLEEIDPQQHRYRYRMLSSAMPVRDYVAEFRVSPEDKHSCTVVWTADFQVNSGNEAEVEGRYLFFREARIAVEDERQDLTRPQQADNLLVG